MSTTELSAHRKRLRELLDHIEKLSFVCAYPDPLIQGTPGEVFRSCGRATCRCAKNPTQKHGPYLVIQVYKDKKQKQVTLRKEQKELWIRAKNYQKQMHTLLELKKTCSQLTEQVQKILDQRIEDLP